MQAPEVIILRSSWFIKIPNKQLTVYPHIYFKERERDATVVMCVIYCKPNERPHFLNFSNSWNNSEWGKKKKKLVGDVLHAFYLRRAVYIWQQKRKWVNNHSWNEVEWLIYHNTCFKSRSDLSLTAFTCKRWRRRRRDRKQVNLVFKGINVVVCHNSVSLSVLNGNFYFPKLINDEKISNQLRLPYTNISIRTHISKELTLKHWEYKIENWMRWQVIIKNHLWWCVPNNKRASEWEVYNRNEAGEWEKTTR